MTADTKSKSNGGGNNAIKGKKGKQRYLPHNKPVKRKGSYPLRPGVQGFFITCDGGRESQASHEAINVIDSFYEELVHGKDSGVKLAELPKIPLNKKIKFSYSESSSSGGDDEEEDEGQIISDTSQNDLASHPNAMNEGPDPHTKDGMHHENQTEEKANGIEADADKHENQPKETEEPPTKKQRIETGALDGDKHENQPKETEETPTKKQCIETGASEGDKHENQPKETEETPAKKQCIETGALKHVIHEKVEETSIDRLIEAELKELGDKNKRRFVKLDSGCNGVGFIQMRKIDGDPGPKDIVQHIMTSAASTKKHMSRFILRMLPIEVACYTSEEEISRAIKPLVAQYFPVETQNPQKFAVLFEARANSGIDRMKIINAVAKSVPGPHKVDLNNPDKTIVVEIIKTVCLIGVVEQYKGLAKYNLRQLTSPKP